MTAHDQEDPHLAWWKRDIIVPTTEFERAAVVHTQRVLRCDETGKMDEATISHLRGLQALFGLPTTGILDEATARQIERVRSYWTMEVE